MAKFRIQDIVPPEKKKRIARKESRATSHATETEYPIEHGAPLPPHDTFSEERPVPQERKHPAAAPVTKRSAHKRSEPEYAPEKRESTELSPGSEGEMPVLEERPVVRHEVFSEDEPKEEFHPGFDDEPKEEDDRFTPEPRRAPPLAEHIYTYEKDDLPRRPLWSGVDRGKWMPWVVGTVLALVGGFLAMGFFANARVTVVPKTEPLTLDKSFSAAKSPEAGMLGFSVMRVEQSETREIPATGSKDVTAKASGKIVIYNDYGAKTQRLIKNTRFQSPSGKIYRINESINVPGQKTAGGKTTPGTIEVTVYADEAGPAYNTEPTDFTIPGLKGDARYEKIYARSLTPIAGGAAHTVKTASENDLKRAKEDLRVALEAKLRTKAREGLAPTQVLYDQGIILSLGEAEITEGGTEGRATVKASGAIHAVIFDRAGLARAIAKESLPAYNGEDLTIPNLDALMFMMPVKGGEDLWKSEKLDFTLKGEAQLRFAVDTMAVRRDLAGMKKDLFNGKMAGYATVERATATIRPFWRSSFPSDPDKIEVVVSND